MLGQNNPVFGMLSSVISGCSGKGTALDSGAGLSVHQRGEVVCNRSSWVLRIGCWGDPPSPPPPRSWRCRRGGPRRGAASPEDAKSLHLVAIRVGISSWWGIFPCRAANLVTGGEVSLPPCAAACPCCPQLVPREGRAAAPWLIPWLPPGRSHPAAWARSGGGLRLLPSGLFFGQGGDAH